MARICLLSPLHLWINPRLVKEADALVEAGHEVVVGQRAVNRAGCDRDDAILATKRWTAHRFNYARDCEPRRWFLAAIRERIARALLQRGWHGERLDAEAYLRGYEEMRDWAIRQRADLYIAHSQPALPVAAAAAAATGAAFAFDCEDLLAEERADGLRAPWRRALITRIEERYLPRAAYVSVPASPMRDYLVKRYTLSTVHVWHNCFPIAETEGLLPPSERQPTERIRIVWMSATLAPGRGLEDLLRAIPHLDERFEVCLLGNVLDTHRSWFESTIQPLMREHRVFQKPLPPAAEVMKEIARHDIGLSLDRNDCLNRSLNVCNKMCIYLQAGIAILATDTPGQRAILEDAWTVGGLYPEGNVAEMIRVLEGMSGRDTLRRMQSEAWDAGRSKYNWDAEKTVFLSAVEEATAPKHNLAGV